ncbi:myb-like protein V isoform X2 [Drosophila hydei]|uniref:Myb-like protein V isoform X2 n=1 Tax=Drosophila hydei TaxID=7224 RepID=A0A6J1MQU6_DROHY|nr:myb-like protein V isoform X2 [Drosophila hydei]
MFAGIRKRLARKQNEKDCDEDDKDDVHDIMPPANYIQISQGKIQLVHQARSLEHEPALSLERASDKSQCGSPTFEKELREQIENMNRIMKSKERKQLQTCRDHKALQTRFARQESLLHTMQQENRALLTRIRQYEHCLDDVMRKVVDAIVAEDNLREEVSMLKSRVRDLEAQNAALSASPVKGRDEGYCTMSSGQPQPSNGHLEDLPEEPEQWLLPAEPCSTEMEDWSMSQEELAVITFDDERDRQQLQLQRRKREHDWLWPSSDFINSTTVETDDSVADGIAQLLQQKLVYSEDEEVACTNFTNDFYKLVNIRSNSSRSLFSYVEGETDDEDDEDEEDEQDSSMSESQIKQRVSPTPSEAGRAQLTSCSSSETDEHSVAPLPQQQAEAEEDEDEHDYAVIDECRRRVSDIEIEDVPLVKSSSPPLNEQQCIAQIIKTELRRPPHVLVKSKSVLEEQEPSCILRHNQRRELESSVVRSDSISCALMAKMAKDSPPSPAVVSKLKERLLQRHPANPTANSWRRSNGWKRVTSPVAGSPKKETTKTTELPKSCQQKAPPTRIPTCIHTTSTTSSISSSCSSSTPSSPSPPKQTQKLTQQQQKQQSKQQQPSQQRKSKIPPPVPVRRSYAS